MCRMREKNKRNKTWFVVNTVILAVIVVYIGLTVYANMGVAVNEQYVSPRIIQNDHSVCAQIIPAPYYRTTLTSKEQKLYDAYRYAYETGNNTFTIKGSFSQQEVDNTLAALKADYPIFTMSTAPYESAPPSNDRVFSCSIFGINIPVFRIFGTYTNFSISPKELENVQKAQEGMQKAQQIAAQSPHFNSQAEQARYFYDYLIQNTEYEDDPQFHDASTFYTITDALVEGKSNCDGIANAYLALCRYAGIECFKVYYNPEDLGKDSGHVWNIVNLDGQYYHVDVSHGRNLYDEYAQECPNEKIIPYEYFANTGQQIYHRGETIHPQIESVIPPCNNASLYQSSFDVTLTGSNYQDAVSMISAAYQQNKQENKTYVSCCCSSEEILENLYNDFSGALGDALLERMNGDSSLKLKANFTDNTCYFYF